jgi:hypothetical protein
VSTIDPAQPVTWVVDGMGLTHYDDAGCRWIVTGTTGWRGTPKRRTRRTPRANRHGSFRAIAYLDDRIVTLTGVCHAPTPAARARAESQIAGLFGDPASLARVWRMDETGAPLVGYFELEDAIEPVPMQSSTWFTWDLQIAAPDPRKFEASWSTVTSGIQTAGSGGVDATTPGASATGGLVAGAPGVLGTGTMVNRGNAEIGPVLQLIGPLTNPEVRDINSGSSLSYSGDIASGDSLWINCDDQPAYETPVGTLPGHSVSLGGYSNRRANLTTYGWWPVLPAGGRLVLLLTGGVAAGNMTAYYRSAWR